MSTIVTETNNKIILTTKGIVLDNSRDVASSWASKHVVDNPNIKWILGKYVEADNPNSNGQFWQYDDLRLSQPTIHHSPMNIDHHQDEIVGTWVASEMMMPTQQASVINPYIEALGAFWQWYFPEKMQEVQAAHDSGKLFISMECVSESITCGGDNGCGQTFDYQGPMSSAYCEHIQERSSYRQLNKSQFLGGALIMPGTQPGWKNAAVQDISSDAHEKSMTAISQAMPDGTEEDWERLLWKIQMQALQSSFFTKN